MVEEILAGASFFSQNIIHLGQNWIHDVLDVKLSKISKVHTYDSGFDMMIKELPRDTFEKLVLVSRERYVRYCAPFPCGKRSNYFSPLCHLLSKRVFW